jgi:4-carboxymuconolactone decarboxylase
MPRIPYPDPATRSEVQRRSMEHPLNLSKMTAYMPDRLLTTMGQFGRAVLNNPDLDEHLREMVILRVGYLSNSPYEIHQHVQLSRQIGMPADKLEALKDGPDAAAFDPRERAMLRFTDELVLNVRPSDAALAEIQEHMSLEEVFSVIATAGTYMLMCRILETTGVELDEEGVVIDPAGG